MIIIIGNQVQLGKIILCIVNAVNEQHFCSMTAWMLLYIGDDMCHVYAYEKQSGILAA